MTLGGGGMFVVDHNGPPMRIVAEYDRYHVDDNGCGEMEAGGRMYVNSGAGAPDEMYGHDVYAFELDRLRHRAEHAAEHAGAARWCTAATGRVDAHAVALTRHGRYLWWGDRIRNDVMVVDPETNEVVNRFPLAGDVSGDPAPDLFDLSPSGHMFASLRGPRPGHRSRGLRHHPRGGRDPGAGRRSPGAGWSGVAACRGSARARPIRTR